MLRARADRRRRLTAGDLNVEHDGQVARAELADLRDDEVRLADLVLAGLEELVRRADDSGALHARPVAVELRVDETRAVGDARGTELNVSAGPIVGALVVADVDALHRSVRVRAANDSERFATRGRRRVAVAGRVIALRCAAADRDADSEHEERADPRCSDTHAARRSDDRASAPSS